MKSISLMTLTAASAVVSTVAFVTPSPSTFMGTRNNQYLQTFQQQEQNSFQSRLAMSEDDDEVRAYVQIGL